MSFMAVESLYESMGVLCSQTMTVRSEAVDCLNYGHDDQVFLNLIRETTDLVDKFRAWQVVLRSLHIDEP